MGEDGGDSHLVYLDYNATTPLAPEVVNGISSSLSSLWGNPSSGYATGRRAAKAVDVARCQVARMIGATADQITFTSGGTESNTHAIQSALASFKRHSSTNDALPHVITTNVEHPAIRLPLQKLEQDGVCQVSYVGAVCPGRVTTQDVLAQMTPSTCLVTMMLANNETGAIQPVAEVFSEIRKINPSRKIPILLHTDAAQSIGKMKVDAEELGADLLTIVGHKFYGPRIGALYHRDSAMIQPIFLGGGQEKGKRAGTENTPMIVGLGLACQLVTDNIDGYEAHLRDVRDYLRDQLMINFEFVMTAKSLNIENPLTKGQISWRYVDGFQLPNTLSVRFGGTSGAELLAACSSDLEASTGAACHTGTVSQILMNSGVSEAGARETVRLSVGRETTKKDIDKVVKAFVKVIKDKGDA